MGRTARRPQPAPSGAVIFYGRSGTKARPRTARLPLTDADRTNTTGSDSDTNSSTTLVPSSMSLDSKISPALPNSPSSKVHSRTTSSPDVKEPLVLASVVEAPQDSSASGYHALTANSATILSLLADITGIFNNVPYVKVLAGVVKQIIDIADQVRANKDRCGELVEKVLNYSRVVFDALLAAHKISPAKFDDLKGDLLQVASVLESIYSILVSLSASTTASRFNRLINRDDISGDLLKQDRRLDTAITSFQLKSSIVLRMNNSTAFPASEVQTMLETSRPRLIRLRSKPQIMFGRDQEIDTIVAAVSNHDGSYNANILTRVAILGPGGIGKTSLALSVLHDARVQAKYGDERVFVSCEAASSPGRLANELAVALQIKAEDVTDHLFDAVIRRLSQKPCIIVLDNFETSWDPPEGRSDVELMLSEITAISKVVVIITLRGSQRPAGVEWSNLMPPLQPVDLDSASTIFRTISQKLDHHAVNLIKAVDCVPLAVTLLANLAAVDGETTKALWARWTEESTAMVEGGQDRLSSLEASVRLSLSSPRMNKDAEALSFLSIIARLPDGMSSGTLRACEKGLPTVVRVKKAVSALRQNSLVFEDADHRLRFLSPIRLYVCTHHPPSPEAHSFLQDIFIGLAAQGTSYDDPEIRQRLFEESGNIEAMLVDALHSSRPLERTVEAVLSFCHFAYASGVGSSEAISIAVDLLAESQVSLPPPGPKPSTLPRLKFFKFLAKPPSLPPATVDPTLKLRGDCLGCWGQLASRRSRFLEAEEKFKLAVKLHIEARDISGQAYDLHNLGCLLSRDKSKLDQAQSYFEQAMKLHEQVEDQSGKAHDLVGLGRVHLGRYEHINARTTFLSAFNIFADIQNDIGMASALNSLGNAMLASCNFVGAENYFAQALKINSDMGDTVSQAENLAGLACSLLLRSRFVEAKVQIENALALRASHVNPDHLHLLGRVLIAMAQYEEAAKILNRSKDLHKESGDVLGSADNNLYLAQIFLWQGYCEEASYLNGEAEDEYTEEDNLIGLADTYALKGVLCMRSGDLALAQYWFEVAVKQHSQVECPLAEAVDLYQLGIFFLRNAQFSDAMEKFQEALRLHTQTGNVQGQADDLNKISETYLRQGFVQEALIGVADALALHIQIGDISGQGDDVYVQASILLEESRFDDAEQTMRKAVKLHTEAHAIYGWARDLATLSSILLQSSKYDERLGGQGIDLKRSSARRTLEEAIRRFGDAEAVGEGNQCRAEYQSEFGQAPC